ncbi:MAG: alpha/beta fold hydrolase [Gemmatimonadales bacterium]
MGTDDVTLRGRRLSLWLPTGVLAIVMGAATGCSRPRASTERVDFRPERVPDDDPSPAAELGFLGVPESRSSPGSRTIELAVLRLPSTSERPGPPIVYLSGGPGSSAIDALSGPRREAIEALRAAGDVVLLDQRGTGRSRPRLDCPASGGLPLDRPSSRPDLVANFRARAAACAEYWRGQGAELGGYRVAEIADDVEALRVALGAPRVVSWGVSFGSHVALAALQRHPESFARLILAGVVGPDDVWPLPSLTDSAFAAIDAAAVGGGGGGLAKRIATLARALDSVPRTGRTRDGRAVTIGGFDLRHAIAGRVSTPTALAEITRMIRQAERGELDEVATLVERVRADGSIGSAMTYLTLCGAPPSPVRRQTIEEETAGSPFGDVLSTAGAGCDAWGVAAPDAGTLELPKSSVPVLAISGSADVTTPPANALRVLRTLVNGRHLLVEGARHGTDLVAGPGVIAAMLAFLAEGQPPPR